MKPKITINQNNQYKLEEGENASLLCNASGYPEPVVMWSKQDKDRELKGKVSQPKSSISILTLKNVSVFCLLYSSCQNSSACQDILTNRLKKNS